MMVAGKMHSGVNMALNTNNHGPITQVQVLRAMTMEQRWRVAQDLYGTAREWKACAVRAFHPEWRENDVREEVRRRFLHAGK